jgi:hypothetical protein
VFNASRIPGVQIANCESEIEVYGVHITTDKGMVENHAYFLGTNYNSSFPASRLIALEERINDLVNKRIYSEIKGDFYFNWTDNKSLLSISIGSVGEYSSSPSRNGIWDAGKPNTISVTANRIGYITINRNTTTVYVDAKPITVATTHLSNYEGGFLHNELVPPAKLSQIDLFHPKQIIQQVQPLK